MKVLSHVQPNKPWNMKWRVIFLSCHLPPENPRRRFAEWNLQIILFHVLFGILAKITTLMVLSCYNCTWLACRQEICTWHWQKLQLTFFSTNKCQHMSQNLQNVLSRFSFLFLSSLWGQSETSELSPSQTNHILDLFSLVFPDEFPVRGSETSHACTQTKE